MLEVFGTFIKLGVDVRLEILAGGGELHADCEEMRLNDESEQKDIWGADCDPINQMVTFKSLINLRPRQNNRKIEVQDPVLRSTFDN